MDFSEEDLKLLKNCEVQTFRSGGKGGQHQNTTDSGVRLIHQPTGIAVTSRDSRSQLVNKMICLEKLKAEMAKRRQRRKKRIATKPKRSSVEKRLTKKKQHSKKKQDRRRKDFD